MKEFYKGAVVCKLFSREENAIDYIKDYFIDKCFIAIFDAGVSKEEIIESVKCNFRED